MKKRNLVAAGVLTTSLMLSSCGITANGSGNNNGGNILSEVLGNMGNVGTVGNVLGSVLGIGTIVNRVWPSPVRMPWPKLVAKSLQLRQKQSWKKAIGRLVSSAITRN